MQMNEPSRWSAARPGAAAATFAAILATSQAIEVTGSAPNWLRGSIAIDTDVYDRFVGWDAEALRRHHIHLDEAARLEHVFQVCGSAAYGAGGCFICKAVDSRGYGAQHARQVLTMTNYGRPAEPLWLIHC